MRYIRQSEVKYWHSTLFILSNRIFNMIQQEEHHRQVMMSRDTRNDTAMAFATRRHTGMVEKGICRICGRYGHEEMACYEVIGYPPRWGTRGRGRGSRGGRNNRGSRGGGRGKERESAVAVMCYEDEGGPGLQTGSRTASNTGHGPVSGLGVVASSSPETAAQVLSLIHI